MVAGEMRSVSYVQRVALEFSGSLFPHAICLGDADNDTLNELVVGDTNGKLCVYKNDDSKPWTVRFCQGMLTCVGVGDVCNRGKNLVVAVSAEGWFHLFDLTPPPSKHPDASGHHEPPLADEQKLVFKQHIPANTKVMLINDIDGDGKFELVVGYTDRVVRAFRWEDLSESSDHISGQLVLLKKWLLEGQVDSLSVNPGPDGVPEMMVSQPGCGYAILLCTWKPDQQPLAESGDSSATSREAPVRDVILHQTSGRIHNKNVSTHLIGSIGRGCTKADAGSGLFALCTLDGTLKLMEGADKLLWSVQVDHQLFALEKLDVTGNGHEEVIACAWDGQTYIIDHNRTVARFQVDENVSAFCAGLYACKGGHNSPCLVYVSFNQKIYIYWDVQLERMESTNLLKILETNPEYRDLLQQLGVDGDDVSAIKDLIHKTLYFPEKQPQNSPCQHRGPAGADSSSHPTVAQDSWRCVADA
ncbi:KICSTOR complex protein ITFG2 isoform X5 [Trachemys scripta elegans]|uniref:KICSTOR complex protein ITFG2 isoform X5 n=1 Tax=Trachemys scripta elegans TaxID=31138 RepID=UPI0015564BD3|nr:KICSTOR complex protein ITFG2 isoform X5 [Trachemys scripta elegans]